jgi:hypothetical protein
MEDNRSIKLSKIPLQIFIDSLIEIYNSGADFVDIVASLDDMQDKLGLYIMEDYLRPANEEAEMEWIKEEDIDENAPSITIKTLTQDDLNTLMI